MSERIEDVQAPPGEWPPGTLARLYIDPESPGSAKIVRVSAPYRPAGWDSQQSGFKIQLWDSQKNEWYDYSFRWTTEELKGLGYEPVTDEAEIALLVLGL